MRKTDILDVASRKLAPFILLFGLYLVSYGHLSPGGGFQGGVVIASAFILLLLGCAGSRLSYSGMSLVLALVEACALMAFLLFGIVGLMSRGHFLGVVFPVDSGGNLPNAGNILLLNLIVGLKVGAGISLIGWYLLRETQSCRDT